MLEHALLVRAPLHAHAEYWVREKPPRLSVPTADVNIASVPGLVASVPGLVASVPGLVACVPGLVASVPGLVDACRTLSPGMYVLVPPPSRHCQ